MTTQAITTAAFISPVDKEKMEAIIRATCEYYTITENDLKNGGKSMELTAIKRECFYLILTNTVIKDKFIAQRLETNRASVFLAKGIIDTHKTIYQQTRNNLRGIVTIANTFEKKTEWLIH